ncbi:MAG: hypothetical protein AB3N23_04075 [Paracoccaceae bacterium]
MTFTTFGIGAVSGFDAASTLGAGSFGFTAAAVAAGFAAAFAAARVPVAGFALVAVDARAVRAPVFRVVLVFRVVPVAM